MCCDESCCATVMSRAVPLCVVMSHAVPLCVTHLSCCATVCHPLIMLSHCVSPTYHAVPLCVTHVSCCATVCHPLIMLCHCVSPTYILLCPACPACPAGKTYVSIKASLVLLNNTFHMGGYLGIYGFMGMHQSAMRPAIGPLLVICKTNHTLNAYLEGLLDAGIRPDQLLRVGHRAKISPRLEECQMRFKQPSSPEVDHAHYELKRDGEALAGLEQEILELQENPGRWEGRRPLALPACLPACLPAPARTLPPRPARTLPPGV